MVPALGDDRVLRGTRTLIERWRADLAAGAARVGWKIGLRATSPWRRSPASVRRSKSSI